MSWTKSSLKQAVQDYLESSETTFVNNIDNFIKSAEEKILKSVQLDVFRKNVLGSGTASNTYLSTPSDYLSSFSLALIDSSNNYNYLLQKHVSFIRDYNPAEATTGTPLYYAEFDDNTFILAPTPSSNFNFELHYFHRPASLTSGSDSGETYLSKNAPNALLYVSLIEGTIFLKNYEALPVYEQKFQAGLLELKNLGEGKSTRDQYRYGEVRREPQA
jgi:hypothetical protein